MNTVSFLRLALVFGLSAVNAAQAFDTVSFTQHKILAVPAGVQGLATNVVGNSLRLYYGVAGGSRIVCTYKAYGANAYNFSDCRNAEANPNDLGVWDVRKEELVTADTVRLEAPNCKPAGCSAVHTAAVLGSPANACGASVEGSLHLLGDLICSDDVVGLRFGGDRHTLDGHGHALVAGHGQIGVFVSGKNNFVTGITVDDINGTGLFAYNADALTVYHSKFRRNRTGINLYLDALNAKHVQIIHNDISQNSEFALRFNGDRGFKVDQPELAENDLSRSGVYAVWMEAAQFHLRDGHNKVTASANGFYFSGGKFHVSHLDLSHSDIPGAQIFFVGAERAVVRHSDLSYSAPGIPNQTRVALHFYRTKEAVVDNVRVDQADVGLKAATEQGTISNLYIHHAAFVKSSVAGIMIQSYDTTRFGKVEIHHNDLRLNPANAAIWIVGTTEINSAAIKNNLQ